MVSLLIIVGVVIILVLGAYAFVLTQKVREMESAKKQKLQAEEEKRAKQQAYIVESLNVISANVIDEDLNLSEATIRCKMLLDALFLEEKEREPYQVLDTVFEQVQNFDTHKARKALSKEERQAQDKARVSVEEKYREALIECFKRLRTFSID